MKSMVRAKIILFTLPCCLRPSSSAEQCTGQLSPLSLERIALRPLLTMHPIMPGGSVLVCPVQPVLLPTRPFPSTVRHPVLEAIITMRRTPLRRRLEDHILLLNLPFKLDLLRLINNVACDIQVDLSVYDIRPLHGGPQNEAVFHKYPYPSRH
ncbi:hypothetical protein J3R30DRAFT_2179713 [Lentinula aciculospora]|uniref:Uncharacterized protein n=1 Tax=Lentinula aciculospora TaxID=153920 RepID=A0A9W9AI49_9AGAR|nr:hypothetical protein J3R30DRAFT_2179713 [Lentinula aciculospora]